MGAIIVGVILLEEGCTGAKKRLLLTVAGSCAFEIAVATGSLCFCFAPGAWLHILHISYTAVCPYHTVTVF